MWFSSFFFFKGLFSSPCINKSSASTYIGMLSKSVAAWCFVTCYPPPPHRSPAEGAICFKESERLRDTCQPHLPRSYVRSCEYKGIRGRSERAWFDTARPRLHGDTHCYRSVQSAGWIVGGGESSCSLDAAPVWADKGHAGEALWDLRSSDVNCIRKVASSKKLMPN